MGVRWLALFLVVLLACQIQYVNCPDLDSCKDHSSPESSLKDHCGNTTTDCSKATSEEKILSWISSTLSCIMFFAPVKRVLGLQSSVQDANAAETLFRWSFFFGLQAYILWSCYFWRFYQYPQCPGFPVLLSCSLGVITNAVLLVLVIIKAPVVNGVQRNIILALSILVLVCGCIFKDTRYIGWVAVAFGVLSHSCRIASTDYYANLNVLQFFASLVGGGNGFLWLIHPQLCIFFEFKKYVLDSLMGNPCLELWPINMNSLVINVAIWIEHIDHLIGPVWKKQ